MKMSLDRMSTNGFRTPLGRAIESRDLQACRLALDAGADPNDNFDGRQSMLLASIEVGFTDGALLLLDRGASANGERGDYASPLIAAARTDQLEVCRALIEKGARIVNSPSYGKNPLLIAVHRRHAEICKLLASAGADVHVLNTVDTTPLHLAATDSHLHAPQVIRALIDCGADPNHVPAHRVDVAIRYSTPFQVAVIEGRDANVAVFLECGCDPEELARDGTPLTELAGSPATARLLRSAIAERQIKRATDAGAFPTNQSTRRGTGPSPL